MKRPDRDSSSAVFIGVSEYDDSHLRDIPAARNNLADLGSLLTNARSGTFSVKNCAGLLNPRALHEVGRTIADFGNWASDVFVLYYAGHGLIDARGRLHLALTSTNPEHPGWSSISFDLLREEIAHLRAANRIVILDCCYSGQAIEALGGGGSGVELAIDGTYILSSSRDFDTSITPVGHRNTAFTSALLEVLQSHPGGTIEQVYREVESRLLARGYPRPSRRAVNTSGDIVLYGHAPRTEPFTGHRPRSDWNPGMTAWMRKGAQSGETRSVGALAMHLAQIGDFAESDALYRQLISRGEIGAAAMLGASLADRGDYSQAEHWFRTVLTTSPNDPEAMALLGVTLARQGKLDESAHWIRRSNMTREEADSLFALTTGVLGGSLANLAGLLDEATHGDVEKLRLLGKVLGDM